MGGGPAGAAFALRMVTLGHDVLVVERSSFPRPHVGEVLTPGVWPLLTTLEVAGDVQAGHPLLVREALVAWSESENESIRLPPRHAGLTVDRGHFDAVLLAAASSAGARVWYSASAGRPQAARSGWTLDVRTRHGIRTVRAEFVADATGRARLLAGMPARRSVPSLALHARWRGDPTDQAQTRLEAIPDGWLWQARLPDNLFRIIALIDPIVLRRARSRGSSAEDAYLALVASAGILDGIRHPELHDRVFACDATPYLDEQPITLSSIRLGDASCAIDPLSSSGVQKALQSAIAGSSAVHTIRKANGDSEAALQFYREMQRAEFESHAEWTADYYGSPRRFENRQFWQRRLAAGSVSRRDIRRSGLKEALSRPARLVAEAALIPTPCLVRDQVVRRRALTHPTLRRPVAYLGGAELAPLIDTMARSPTLAEALRQWEGTLLPAECARVAEWFLARGLLDLN